MTGDRYANDPQYRDWLTESRRSQGVPLTTVDPLVIAEAVEIFAAHLRPHTTKRRRPTTEVRIGRAAA